MGGSRNSRSRDLDRSPAELRRLTPFSLFLARSENCSTNIPSLGQYPSGLFVLRVCISSSQTRFLEGIVGSAPDLSGFRVERHRSFFWIMLSFLCQRFSGFVSPSFFRPLFFWNMIISHSPLIFVLVSRSVSSDTKLFRSRFSRVSSPKCSFLPPILHEYRIFEIFPDQPQVLSGFCLLLLNFSVRPHKFSFLDRSVRRK